MEKTDLDPNEAAKARIDELMSVSKELYENKNNYVEKLTDKTFVNRLKNIENNFFPDKFEKSFPPEAQIMLCQTLINWYETTVSKSRDRGVRPNGIEERVENVGYQVFVEKNKKAKNPSFSRLNDKSFCREVDALRSILWREPIPQNGFSEEKRRRFCDFALHEYELKKEKASNMSEQNTNSIKKDNSYVR